MGRWQAHRGGVPLEALTDRGKRCCPRPLALLTRVQNDARRQSMIVCVAPHECKQCPRRSRGARLNAPRRLMPVRRAAQPDPLARVGTTIP